MKQARPFVHLLLLAALLLGSGFSRVQAQSADQIFQRLKAKYDSIASLRAEFSQTMTSSYTDEAATSQGLLILQGNRYRVETQGQTLVTDGKVTWVYVPSENQVLINDYVEDETTFSINEFFFNYEDHYKASKVKTARLNGEKHYVLTLTPKRQDAFFKQVTLSMRDRDNVVTQMEVVDVNDTTMTFNLKNIQLNPKLGPNTFKFTPPQNAEVVDLRS